jgi:hypothetical protein
MYMLEIAAVVVLVVSAAVATCVFVVAETRSHRRFQARMNQRRHPRSVGL